MQIAYIRVSSIDQNEQRQIEAMQRYNIEKWFIEKVSGKDTNRPKLKEMLDFAREGDTIHIHDFSRLARSTKDLLDIVELLNSKGITLISNKENGDVGQVAISDAMVEDNYSVKVFVTNTEEFGGNT